jgi:hypothetical protein
MAAPANGRISPCANRPAATRKTTRQANAARSGIPSKQGVIRVMVVLQGGVSTIVTGRPVRADPRMTLPLTGLAESLSSGRRGRHSVL